MIDPVSTLIGWGTKGEFMFCTNASIGSYPECKVEFDPQVFPLLDEVSDWLSSWSASFWSLVMLKTCKWLLDGQDTFLCAFWRLHLLHWQIYFWFPLIRFSIIPGLTGHGVAFYHIVSGSLDECISGIERMNSLVYWFCLDWSFVWPFLVWLFLGIVQDGLYIRLVWT